MTNASPRPLRTLARLQTDVPAGSFKTPRGLAKNQDFEAMRRVRSLVWAVLSAVTSAACSHSANHPGQQPTQTSPATGRSGTGASGVAGRAPAAGSGTTPVVGGAGTFGSAGQPSAAGSG